MDAVIESGGMQHRVRVGDVVRVERLDVEVGDPVVFQRVLAVGDGATTTLGRPTVAGATVKGTVVEKARGAKVIIYTFKHRKNSNRKRRGHRQDYTAVRIESIEA